jgi:uncharacterized protein
MIGIVGLAAVSGLLIGCIGIGGVLLVPGLSLAGMDVHEAIAASMFSFIFSGLLGTWLYARKGSIEWTSAGWLGAGAIPGALAGAVLAAKLGGDVLLALIGAAVIFAGARSLGRRQAVELEAKPPRPAILALIGIAVGLGSAVTGTGGPLLLVPLLMYLRVPVLASVGLGQAIQIPIAGFASVGNLWTGHLEFRLGILLSTGLLLGTAVGVRVAHAAPTLFLTRLVAIVLLLVGAFLLVRSSYAFPWSWH